MIKEFDYIDSKGKHSHRVVHVISEPSDNMLAIDLTEFSENERQAYEEALEEIYSQAKALIREEVNQLGLGGNYRAFKKERISE